MTEDRDELLVRKFFEENKVELADDGFSQRVMRRLPDRTRRLSRIWTAVCTLAGILMCVVFNWIDVLVGIFNDFISWLPLHGGQYIVYWAVWLLLLSIIFVGGYKAVADE